MNKKTFRSGQNPIIFVGLIIYHIVLILPLFLNKYLEKDVISWCSYLLLAVDVGFLLPLIFNTYYSLEDSYLFVYQWPFSRIKINYGDIFIIDTSLPSDVSKRKLKKYGFVEKSVIIGYYAKVKDKKDKTEKEVKKYIAITPSDYDLFLISIGGKFSEAKKLAEKLEAALKIAKESEEKKQDVEQKKDKHLKIPKNINPPKKETSNFEKPEAKKDPVPEKKEEKPKDETDEKAKEDSNDNIIIAKGVKNIKIKIVDDDEKD